MTTGKPSPLISSFKLTYYTLLNVMRRLEGSGHDMEYVIKRSFSQFQHEQQVNKHPTGALVPFPRRSLTRRA